MSARGPGGGIVGEGMIGMGVGTVWTIDFEGTGLLGYPIEVGVASHDPVTGATSTWSTLVRPVAAWLDDVEGYWDSDAERIHGIPRGEVEAEGVHPRDAMAALNGMVGDGVAHCDGGGFDERYLFLLAEGAGLSPTFRLAGVTELARRLDDGSGAGAAARVADFLVDDEGSVAHRAAADALRLLGFFLPRAPHKA